MSEQRELLPRYLTDADRSARQRLVDGYAPLVYSVCRRYLRRPQDVQDAAQETFLKLARHAPHIDGSVTAWLVSTAYSSSIDLIRRDARERQRRRRHADCISSRPSDHSPPHPKIAQKLSQAIQELDSPRRELIVEHFLHRTPMRLLAGRNRVSVSSISRRMSAGLSELADVLNDMGVKSADQLTLAEHFGDGAALQVFAGPDTLRFAPDWRAGEALVPRAGKAVAAQQRLPGWSRPLRVGVLVSYRSTLAVGRDGKQWPAELQLHSTRWIPPQGFQLVSIIEPDTSECGPVECAMREHELTGGLIDVCDADALKTLDVILLGWNRSLSDRAAAAINHAVRSGVGLLNEYWTGSYEKMRESADIQGLMLAGCPIHAHHAAHHGQLGPARVVHEHALLPGLKPGMPVAGRGCGPVYRPVEGATVLSVSQTIIGEQEHRIAGLGPTPMPICIAGQLGRGRVWVANCFDHHRLAPHLAVGFGDYLRDLLMWLGEGRRE
jgi:RNA polymerase sigma factor (sigma-70 family)